MVSRATVNTVSDTLYFNMSVIFGEFWNIILSGTYAKYPEETMLLVVYIMKLKMPLQVEVGGL